MSKLILTTFEKSDANAVLKDYEKSLVPSKGEKVFIYVRDKSKKISDDKDVNNLANRNVIKKSMGWAKLDKYANMSVSQVKAMTNNKNGAEFIDSRTKELSEMYDYLSDLFLDLLHKSTWSGYGTQNDGKIKYVLSTIDFDQCYDDLKLMVESMQLVLEKIVNDKYNEKYSEVEVQNSIKQKNLEIEQVVGTIKKK